MVNGFSAEPSIHLFMIERRRSTHILRGPPGVVKEVGWPGQGGDMVRSPFESVHGRSIWSCLACFDKRAVKRGADMAYGGTRREFGKENRDRASLHYWDYQDTPGWFSRISRRMRTLSKGQGGRGFWFDEAGLALEARYTYVRYIHREGSRKQGSERQLDGTK